MIQSPVGAFLVLSGPRVKNDGCFLVKLIHLPAVGSVSQLHRLRSSAMLMVNGTPVGRIWYRQLIYEETLNDQLISPWSRVLCDRASFAQYREARSYRNPVNILKVYGAERLFPAGPVPVSSLRIEPEDPVDEGSPEDDPSGGRA